MSILCRLFPFLLSFAICFLEHQAFALCRTGASSFPPGDFVLYSPSYSVATFRDSLFPPSRVSASLSPFFARPSLPSSTTVSHAVLPALFLLDSFLRKVQRFRTSQGGNFPFLFFRLLYSLIYKLSPGAFCSSFLLFS